jgi:peptide chain release factor 3
MTNFGVKLFLESFLDYGLPPRGRNSSLGVLDPTYPDFTGFVFKLQANMDPKHRNEWPLCGYVRGNSRRIW